MQEGKIRVTNLYELLSLEREKNVLCIVCRAVSSVSVMFLLKNTEKRDLKQLWQNVKV